MGLVLSARTPMVSSIWCSSAPDGSDAGFRRGVTTSARQLLNDEVSLSEFGHRRGTLLATIRSINWLTFWSTSRLLRAP